MDLSFEWDPAKDEANARKHGVTFEEASTAFGDPLSVTIPDPEHSDREVRFLPARSGTHRARRLHSHHQRAACRAPRTEGL